MVIGFEDSPLGLLFWFVVLFKTFHKCFENTPAKMFLEEINVNQRAAETNNHFQNASVKIF